MSATSVFQCPGCRAPVPAAASEGLCASCLLLGVLERGELDEPEPSDAPPLERCGEYEITGIIARGGMGIVFRAQQAGLSRAVALKMIAAADLAGPDEVRRFRLEAELIARLEHPHIVPIHAVGEHDGRPFFVMKLAEGTLAARLQRERTLPPREAAALMVKVAQAVQFAHGHGVLHRDLKPANILLDAGGEPLVTDFGLARLAHGPGGSTLQGSTLGTPAYMPPEQARGAEAVTTVSDVYGLGAILYHLLTGRPPFTGASPLEILRRAETEEPLPPESLNPRVDRDLATVALKCLQKNPARRYASAADLAEDLNRWLRGEPVTARPAGLAERLWKWARRRPATATLLTTGVAGATALLTILISGKEALRRERNYAQSQTLLAKAQEQIANANTARAEASEHQMRLQVYASDLFLARRAANEGNMGTARRLLERHLPRDGQPDLRGFEWFTLQRQCLGDDQLALTGHTAAVTAVAWHPGGELLATSGRDGLLRLLRAGDGSEVLRLPRVAPASKLSELATLATLPLRSPETAAVLAGDTAVDEMRMRARPSSIGETGSLSWSPDGTLLLTAGPGSYPRLWKMPGLDLQGFIPIKNSTRAAFTADGTLLAVALSGPAGDIYNGEVRLYSTATLRRAATYPGVCATFALSPASPLLALIDKDGNTRLLDFSTGATVHQWASSDLVSTALALSPDARWLATLHRGGLTLRETATGKPFGTYDTPSSPLRTLAFSPDGRTLAAAGTSQLLHLLDVPTAAVRTSWTGHDDEILALAWAPRSGRLLTGSNDHTARLWASIPRHPLSLRSVINQYAETGELTAVSTTGQYFLGTGPSGAVRCYDTVHLRAPHTPPDIPRRPLGLSPDDDGRFLTLRKNQPMLEWWHADATPDGPPVPLKVPPTALITYAPAPGQIIAAPDKRTLQLHDARTGTLTATLPPGPVAISRIIPSPGGRYLGVFEWPRAFALYDRTQNAWLPRMRLTAGTAGPIVFSPDDTLLASGGDDNYITLHEARTGKEITTLRGHMAEILAIAFSPDGRTLATSSADRTIRLWHTPTWRELGILRRNIQCAPLLFTTTGLVARQYDARWLEFPGP